MAGLEPTSDRDASHPSVPPNPPHPESTRPFPSARPNDWADMRWSELSEPSSYAPKLCLFHIDHLEVPVACFDHCKTRHRRSSHLNPWHKWKNTKINYASLYKFIKKDSKWRPRGLNGPSTESIVIQINNNFKKTLYGKWGTFGRKGGGTTYKGGSARLGGQTVSTSSDMQTSTLSTIYNRYYNFGWILRWIFGVTWIHRPTLE